MKGPGRSSHWINPQFDVHSSPALKDRDGLNFGLFKERFSDGHAHLVYPVITP